MQSPSPLRPARNADTPDKPDYRSTVFLPRTDFPMKAGLPQKEPAIAARWESEGLYQQIRAAREGREKFIFHDGPPYANGDIHIGHALNHTLKDMVVRTQTLLGKDAPYVPGWDCHGLPIEWKVEEQYRKKKLNKDEVPVREFRAECRAYAQHWVDVQREQLKRLGISADWDKPYLTMAKGAEATIVSELFKFAETGQLYRGAKPVMWSPVEKTALAEAEIEYEDIVSTQIDVAFEIVESPIPELVGAHAVVWTTTPWTIPVNQAIAYGPDVEYVVVDATDRRRWRPQSCDASTGRRTFCAELAELVDRSSKREARASRNSRLRGMRVKGSDLAGTIARHPMHKLGGFFARPRPFLPGDFVTTDQGTGLVHMAPDHGEDDFELCKANGIDPVFAVDAGGFYRPTGCGSAARAASSTTSSTRPTGRSARTCARPAPCSPQARTSSTATRIRGGRRPRSSTAARRNGSWRWTSRWRILSPQTRAEQRWENEGGGANEALDDQRPTLRQLAMHAIADTRFVPEKGRNRLGSMVEQRPDWVLSRQRAWGVPIAVFVDRKTGELLVDREVNARIVEAVRARASTPGTRTTPPPSSATATPTITR